MSTDNQWQILIVDDDEDDILITRDMLDQFQGRSVGLDSALTYEDATTMLTTKTYDAVLIDYDLGLRTGIELIREFMKRDYPAPFILLTGRGSYNVDLEAMQAGATLYLTKYEINPLLLERSIRYAIERKQIETDLRRTNQDLIQERNRLLALMEALPVGVAIIDANDFRVSSNAAFERIWGGAPPAKSIAGSEPSRARWVETGQPVQPQEWASAQAFRRSETVTGQYFEIERFDGKRATVINSAAPVFDAEGQVTGSAVAIMDVTEHRRSEEKLRYLASFPEENPNPITEVDLEGNVYYLNHAALRLFPDLPIQKTAHPWLADWQAVESHFQADPAAPLKRQVTIGDRSYHQSLITVPGSRLIRSYGADITERTLAEDALRQSEERFRLALKNMPIVVATLNRDLCYTWVYNPQGGFQSEQIIGRPFGISLHGEAKQAVRGKLESLLATGQTAHWINSASTQAGEMTFETYAEPLRDSTGAISGVAYVAIDVTDRRRAEAALQQSQELFSKAFMAGPNALTISNQSDGRILEVNPSFEKLLGYTREQIIGITSLELNMFVDPDDRVSAVERLQQEGVLRDYELDILTSRGERRTVNISAQMINWKGQDRMITLFHDITERKQADAALRREQAKLATIIDNLPVGVWIADASGRFLSKNAEADRIWAGDAPLVKSTAEYSQYPAWWPETGKELLHEEYPVVRALSSADTVAPVEVCIRRFDNTEGAILVSAAPLLDPDGRVSGAIGINLDITEWRRSQQALAESERKFYSIFQSTPYGIFVVSLPDAVLVDVNDAWLNLFGFRKDEVIGKTTVELGIHPDPQGRQSMINQFVAQGSLRGQIARLCTRSGDCLTFSINMERVEIGGVSYCLGTLEDITQREQLALALEEKTEQLQRYIQGLERSNQALEDFAFIASHDLQEPARKVKAFAESLQTNYSQEIPTSAQDYLDRIIKAAARMQKMLEGLLAYSHLSTQSNSVQPVDLNRVVAEVVSAFEPTIAQSGASVDVAALPTLNADPVQMYQLFQNLLANALKFTRPGVPPVIQIRSQQLSETQTAITIADNGIGFEEEAGSHLFKPFGRLNPPSTYEGGGMRLAICRKIVEQHGGAITASGRPNQGATFTITLPLPPAEQGRPMNIRNSD